MFWIALAAQLAAPNTAPPAQQQGLISYEEYPQAALDRGEQGAVYFQVVINPEGRVDRCTVLGSSGYHDLDDATSRLVTLRARFSPAQDDDRKPTYGTYRSGINWR